MVRSDLNGWSIKPEIIEEFSHENKDCNLFQKLLNCDLKECSSRINAFSNSECHDKCRVVQIVKIKNATAPKNNPSCTSSPRLLRVHFTDGANSYQGLEFDHIKQLSLDIPPGTKFMLKKPVTTLQSFLLLNPANFTFLGGKVQYLFEKWEASNISSAVVRPTLNGNGPPAFIPFGKKIGEFNLSLNENSSEPVKEKTQFDITREAVLNEAKQAGKDNQPVLQNVNNLKGKHQEESHSKKSDVAKKPLIEKPAFKQRKKQRGQQEDDDITYSAPKPCSLSSMLAAQLDLSSKDTNPTSNSPNPGYFSVQDQDFQPSYQKNVHKEYSHTRPPSYRGRAASASTRGRSNYRGSSNRGRPDKPHSAQSFGGFEFRRQQRPQTDFYYN